MYENLKALRLKLGMKQKEFASVFGLPQTTYSGYELGQREPGSDFWIAVADKYDVSIDWLMGFTDDPKRSKFATPSTLDRKYAALDAHGRRARACRYRVTQNKSHHRGPRGPRRPAVR